MNWDEKSVATLRALWANGVPAREIWLILGCTKYAGFSKAHVLKLTPRPSPIKARSNTPAQVKRAPLVTLDVVAPVTAWVMPAAPVSVPISVEPAPATVFKPRTGRQCQWLEGKEKPWRQCNDGAETGRPYCNAHCLRAFVPGRERAA